MNKTSRDVAESGSAIKTKKKVSAKPAVHDVSNEGSRSLRGKMRTRAKLIDAAMQIIGRDGVDGATINAITEAADVGLGSFYNHFKNKEEIALAVFEKWIETRAQYLDVISADVDDAAQAIAYIHLSNIRKAVSEPVWGWFLVHAQSEIALTQRTFQQRARADIERGIQQGRFSIPNADVAASVTVAALIHFVKTVLEGKAKLQTAPDLVEMLMRMYGLSPDDAREVARARVPKAYQF